MFWEKLLKGWKLQTRNRWLLSKHLQRHFECISLSICSRVHIKPDQDRNDQFERAPQENIIDVRSQTHNNDQRSNRDVENGKCDGDELFQNMKDIEHFETSEH